MKNNFYSIIVSFSLILSTLALADNVIVKTYGCGEPYTHYSLPFDKVCYGANNGSKGFQLHLMTFNRSVSYESYQLDNNLQIPRKFAPVIVHKMFDSKGNFVGIVEFTYYVEEGTYPGDGEFYVTSMKVKMENGMNYKVQVSPKIQ